MAAYRRVYDSRHLQADCQEPGSAPELCARQSSMGYLYLFREFHQVVHIRQYFLRGCRRAPSQQRFSETYLLTSLLFVVVSRYRSGARRCRRFPAGWLHHQADVTYHCAAASWNVRDGNCRCLRDADVLCAVRLCTASWHDCAPTPRTRQQVSPRRQQLLNNTIINVISISNLKYVATLPCNLAFMTCFADINVSQGSVATYARCSGMSSHANDCDKVQKQCQSPDGFYWQFNCSLGWISTPE